MSRAAKDLSVLSLFTGAGGLDLGLEAGIALLLVARVRDLGEEANTVAVAGTGLGLLVGGAIVASIVYARDGPGASASFVGAGRETRAEPWRGSGAARSRPVGGSARAAASFH